MKTYKQIISEVGQLGYEYAAGIESSYKEDGLPLDEMSHSELFDYFTAEGDTFPEQVWSWCMNAEVRFNAPGIFGNFTDMSVRI